MKTKAYLLKKRYPAGYEPKSWPVTLLLEIFLGIFGAHRFYVGKIETGILMLITLGGCGIWWLIDLFWLLYGSFKDKNDYELKLWW
jgi:TM2 domain-containing membrane protein YozV